MSEDPESIYCRGEGKRLEFNNQFKNHKGNWVHLTSDPHYCSTGEPVDVDVIESYRKDLDALGLHDVVKAYGIRVGTPGSNAGGK